MIKNFFICLILLLLIDSIWIYNISSPFLNMIKKIQNDNKIVINYNYIAICYLLMAYMIVTSKTPEDSAKLGFFAYAMYHLVNLITFKDWNVYISIADTLWGTFLFYIINKMIQKY